MEINDDKLAAFRMRLCKALEELMDNNKIDNAQDYFYVWQKTRTTLEEELERFLGVELCVTLTRLRA